LVTRPYYSAPDVPSPRYSRGFCWYDSGACCVAAQFACQYMVRINGTSDWDNVRVLECPAKLVRRLVRRLSGDSIGVSSSLFPTVATDPVPTSSMHLQCIEHSLSILLATHDVLYCTNYIHNIQGVI